MMTQRFMGVMLAGLLAMVFFATAGSLNAQNSSSAALAGQVSSQEEGMMEGVLVTARKDGAALSRARRSSTWWKETGTKV